jgi:hypothetical protein
MLLVVNRVWCGTTQGEQPCQSEVLGTSLNLGLMSARGMNRAGKNLNEKKA